MPAGHFNESDEEITVAEALFVGDAGMDLTLVADHFPEPDEKVHVAAVHEAGGGVVANAAVAARRAGASVRMLVQLGRDATGQAVRDALAAAGLAVDASFVPGRTCRVFIILEPHGEKRLFLDEGVSMFPALAEVEAVSLQHVGWVHTAPYAAAAADLAGRCRREGIPLSFDLEPAVLRGGLSPLARLIEGAAAVFCNERAASMLGSDPSGTLLAAGARAVILTRGARGVRFVENGKPPVDIASPVAPRVQDTTGAGDCLAGWFVAGRLAGAAPVAALTEAVAAAALSCETTGAQAAFPDRPALAAFLARSSIPHHVT